MRPVPDQTPDSNLVASITERLQAGLTPVRPLPSDRVLLLIAAIAFVAFSCLAAARLGFFGYESLDALQRVFYYGVVGASAILLTMTMVEAIIPGSRSRISLPAAIALSLALLSAAVIALFPRMNLTQFVTRGIFCFRAGLLCAAVSGLWIYLLVRRGYSTSPIKTSVAASFLAGLAGFAVLALHCPRLDAAHILIWHLGTTVISGLVGLTLGWLAWRRF